MKALLYILLGLSLGSGLTLIALQERFIRERRRLLSLGESQRATATQAAVALVNKQWEQKCKQHTDELLECRARLEASETAPPIVLAEPVDNSEHERQLRDKEIELERIASENKTLRSHLASHQEEIKDLHGQITFLKGEIAKLEEEKRHLPAADDDFLFLGPGSGHLLPGSVARAFIKGHQRDH